MYNEAINYGALGGKLLGAGGGFLLMYMKKRKAKKIFRRHKNIINVPFNFTKDGSQVILNNFMKSKHPLMKNNFTRSDMSAVKKKVISVKNLVLTQSKNVRQFENKWSRWLGVKYSTFCKFWSLANFLL